MDSITQGIVGAVAPQSFAKPEMIRRATLIGFLSGILPDADVFIRSEVDPFLSYEYHRHFSHSLAFIPIGGLIAAGFFWLFYRKKMSFKWIYLFATLGYATHGLLDTCTSYGTYLLWPFSNERLAWNNVSIIDPVYTGILAIGLALTFWKKSKIWAQGAFVLSLLYLLFGVVQRERAESATLALAKERNHVVERVRVFPSLGNLILWRSVYENGGNYYVDAIRTGVSIQTYPGGKIQKFDIKRDFPTLSEDSQMRKDIERFRHFSNQWLVMSPGLKNVVGDLRYGLLPQSRHPLWGIQVLPEKSDQHARFYSNRVVDDPTWDTYFRMLKGQEIDSSQAP